MRYNAYFIQKKNIQHAHTRTRKQMLTYWEHTCTRHMYANIWNRTAVHTHPHTHIHTHTMQTPPHTHSHRYRHTLACAPTDRDSLPHSYFRELTGAAQPSLSQAVQ